MTSAFIISINKYPFSLRAIVFIVATLLLHLLVLQSTDWQNWSISEQPSTEKIVSIQLHAEPHVAESAVINQAFDHAANKSKIKEKSTTIFEPNNAPASELMAAIENPSEKVDTGMSIVDDKMPEATSQESAFEEVNLDAVAAPEPAKYAVRAPGSVRIEMALVRTKPDTSQNYGVGSINWTVKEGKYDMSIDAGLDLVITSFNLYKLTSEGRLDKFGITPNISTEARRTRASTATHFHHEEKTISFSASSKVVAMNDGAQDKASFLMQLASIGYADEKQFYAGKEIEMQVAEERDATLFHFLVLGKEEIDSKLGKISTWHLLRAPRPGTYNSQLDIWLAPELGWYPVQIRNTERNGTVTEQTATKVVQTINIES
jgi:hypothetical protein